MGTTATTFDDSRWVEGCWDFDQFKGANGEVDWNEVVDAEVRRRKILELFPAACDDKVPVTFDLSMIPWKVSVSSQMMFTCAFRVCTSNESETIFQLSVRLMEST